MWKRCYSATSVKPESLDVTSSQKWNYIRKDFELIEASGEEGHEIPEHWTFLENKVLKEDWETYTQVIDHGEALNDVYAALTELAEMIVEG